MYPSPINKPLSVQDPTLGSLTYHNLLPLLQQLGSLISLLSTLIFPTSVHVPYFFSSYLLLQRVPGRSHNIGRLLSQEQGGEWGWVGCLSTLGLYAGLTKQPSNSTQELSPKWYAEP